MSMGAGQFGYSSLAGFLHLSSVERPSFAVNRFPRMIIIYFPYTRERSALVDSIINHNFHSHTLN